MSIETIPPPPDPVAADYIKAAAFVTAVSAWWVSSAPMATYLPASVSVPAIAASYLVGIVAAPYFASRTQHHARVLHHGGMQFRHYRAAMPYASTTTEKIANVAARAKTLAYRYPVPALG
jgi:hypothetical protein